MTNAIIEMPDTLQTTATSSLSVTALADFHEGLAMMEAGQGRKAVAALSRCLEQAPTFAAGHIWLGIAHAVTCDVYPAIDNLEKATELAPDNFAAHYTLAKYYFTLRLVNKGYDSAEHALACATKSEERIALSQLLQKERERERSGMARPLFNRKFGIGFGLIAASGIAALVCSVLLHLK